MALDGFEGPLDLLLDLARAQKLDLARISIVSLVDQYLAVIEGARRVRLELAADWLVMAAWLTWLKSRLLLPPDTMEAEEGALAADGLAAKLAALQAMRLASAWLGARPALGHDVFARGTPEDFTEADRSRLLLDQGSLVRAYLAARRRVAAGCRYSPAAVTFWTVREALERLTRLALGAGPRDGLWSLLEAFLPYDVPHDLTEPRQRRAAMASTLIAGLELARGGGLYLRQERPFGPILLRQAER